MTTKTSTMPKTYASRPVHGQAAEMLRLVIEAGGCWGIVPAIASSKAGWLVSTPRQNVWFSALSGDRLVKRGLIERVAAPERPLPFGRVGVAYAATLSARTVCAGKPLRPILLCKRRGGRPATPLSQGMYRLVHKAAKLMREAAAYGDRPLPARLKLELRRCAEMMGKRTDTKPETVKRPKRWAPSPELRRVASMTESLEAERQC